MSRGLIDAVEHLWIFLIKHYGILMVYNRPLKVFSCGWRCGCCLDTDVILKLSNAKLIKAKSSPLEENYWHEKRPLYHTFHTPLN